MITILVFAVIGGAIGAYDPYGFWGIFDITGLIFGLFGGGILGYGVSIIVPAIANNCNLFSCNLF